MEDLWRMTWPSFTRTRFKSAIWPSWNDRRRTRLRVLERQVQEVKADLERQVELQNYKPQIANGKLAA